MAIMRKEVIRQMRAFRIFFRSIRDALKSVVRNFSLSFASIMCTTITLILVAVAVVMSFNMGAFMSESIRGALLSVDEGQKEAAYSLGMTNFQLITRIIIPQAVRVALPPLFNDVINLIKMTSLAFMLGVPDIMGAAKIEGAKTFRYFEIYAAVMLIYWVIIFLLGLVHKVLEKKCANMY